MKKISLNIQRQVPEYIRANYPVFLAFLKAYYEYLEISETNGNFRFYWENDIYYIDWVDGGWDGYYVGNQVSFIGTSFNNNTFTIVEKISDRIVSVKEAVVDEGGDSGIAAKLVGGVNFYADELSKFDLDKSLDMFVERTIESLYSVFDSNNLLYDKRFTLKHLNDLIDTKGEEESVKILFRLLFNDDNTTVIYPWEQVAKPSDGIWVQPLSIKVKQLTGASELIDFSTFIMTNGNGAEAFAESFEVYYENSTEVVEVKITRSSLKGNFAIGDTVTDKNLNTFEVLPVLNRKKITVVEPGDKYEVGQKITDDKAGSIVISEVTSKRKIKAIDILNGGSGYTDENTTVTVESLTGSDAKVTAVIFDGTITGIIIDDPGHDYEDDNTTVIFDGGIDGQGATAKVTVDYSGPISKVKVLNYGSTYTEPEVFTITEYGSGAIDAQTAAVVSIEPGAYVDQYGRYIGVKGQPSSNFIRIHDSFYYQKFSYVIKTSASIRQWGEMVKKLIHPGGTELFGEIFINNHENVKMFSKHNIEDKVGNRKKYREYIINIVKRVIAAVSEKRTVSVSVRKRVSAQTGFTHKKLNEYKFRYPNYPDYNYFPTLDSAFTGQSFSMSYVGTTNSGYWNNYYATPIRAFGNMVISDVTNNPNKVMAIQRESYIKIYK